MELGLLNELLGALEVSRLVLKPLMQDDSYLIVREFLGDRMLQYWGVG